MYVPRDENQDDQRQVLDAGHDDGGNNTALVAHEANNDGHDNGGNNTALVALESNSDGHDNVGDNTSLAAYEISKVGHDEGKTVKMSPFVDGKFSPSLWLQDFASNHHHHNVNGIATSPSARRPVRLSPSLRPSP